MQIYLKFGYNVDLEELGLLFKQKITPPFLPKDPSGKEEGQRNLKKLI